MARPTTAGAATPDLHPMHPRPQAHPTRTRGADSCTDTLTSAPASAGGNATRASVATALWHHTHTRALPGAHALSPELRTTHVLVRRAPVVTSAPSGRVASATKVAQKLACVRPRQRGHAW